jgi:hypothetical protein
MKSITLRWARFDMARAFGNWFEHAQGEKQTSLETLDIFKNRSADELEIARMILSNTRRAWNRWKDEAKHLKIVHVLRGKAVRRLRRRELARATTAWRANTLAKKRLKHIGRRATAILKHRSLFGAFCNWRKLADFAAASRKFNTGSRRARFLTRFLLDWFHQADRPRRIRALAERGMKRLKHRAAALAVSAWSFKACEQARLRVLGQRAVLRWRRATCSKCFYLWQDQANIVDDEKVVNVNVPVHLADTATRSAEKHAAPGAVFQMVLDMDFSEIEGKHDDFKNKIMMDLIHSIGCQPSKIEVLQLNPGSIIATILLKSDAFADGKSPNDAVAEMLMQMNDPQSPLMCGQLTSKTTGVKMQDVESIVSDAKNRDKKAAEQLSSLKEHTDAERQALHSKVGVLENELQETKRALALDESGLGRELEQLMQNKHVLLQEKQA